MLYNIILFVIVLICVLLTIVILLQPGQGQGLSGGLAGGMQGGGGIGARRTADLLSKSTSVLGGALLALSLLANFAIERGDSAESAVQQSGVEIPVQQNGNDLNNSSQSPSAVPELPQDGNDSGADDAGENSGGSGTGSGSGSEGSGSDGGN